MPIQKYDSDGNPRFPDVAIALDWSGTLLSMTIDGEEMPWLTSLNLKVGQMTEVVIGIPVETIRISGPSSAIAHLQPLAEQGERIDIFQIRPDLPDCTHCRRALLPESRFCSWCGTPVPPDHPG